MPEEVATTGEKAAPVTKESAFAFIKEALTSKKFWMAVSACAAIWGAEGKAGLWKIVAIVGAYLGAQGITDVGVALAKKEEK